MPPLFFEVSEISADSFVSVTANVAIAGFELVRTSGGDLLGLNARDGLEQLTQLFFPQVAVLGPWKSELGLVNYSSTPVIATISVFKPDGTLYAEADLQNNPVTAIVGSNDSLLADVETLFGFAGEQTLDGWLLVESTSASLNGFISYGLPGTGSVASVTSSAQGQKRAIFSHIATSGGFFTGVAVLNSGQLATNVTILAIQPTGVVLGSFNTVLKPGERLSKLIDEGSCLGRSEWGDYLGQERPARSPDLHFWQCQCSGQHPSAACPGQLSARYRLGDFPGDALPGRRSTRTGPVL